MTCPVCGERSGVSHTELKTDVVKRYRRCKLCGYRFITIELDFDQYNRLEAADLANVKRQKGIKNESESNA